MKRSLWIDRAGWCLTAAEAPGRAIPGCWADGDPHAGLRDLLDQVLGAGDSLRILLSPELVVYAHWPAGDTRLPQELIEERLGLLAGCWSFSWARTATTLHLAALDPRTAAWLDELCLVWRSRVSVALLPIEPGEGDWALAVRGRGLLLAAEAGELRHWHWLPAAAMADHGAATGSMASLHARLRGAAWLFLEGPRQRFPRRLERVRRGLGRSLIQAGLAVALLLAAWLPYRGHLGQQRERAESAWRERRQAMAATHVPDEEAVPAEVCHAIAASTRRAGPLANRIAALANLEMPGVTWHSLTWQAGTARITLTATRNRALLQAVALIREADLLADCEFDGLRRMTALRAVRAELTGGLP